MSNPKSVIFVPHGGGPLPLLNDHAHRDLTAFLKAVPSKLVTPSAIIVVTAHWESPKIQVSTAAKPGMLFDYYGFPPESYHFRYPAPGQPQLANDIVTKLNEAGIAAEADGERGFDHGAFVPLMLMYPDANIPVVQMSLNASLNPASHIKLGEQLAQFIEQGALILGSGLSFHNLRIQFANASAGEEKATKESVTFDSWLAETLSLPMEEAEKRMINWESAPYARYCHPREEHLLPLHVCFGVAKGMRQTMTQIYSNSLLGTQVSGFAA